jgi:hypothetical protein
MGEWQPIDITTPPKWHRSKAWRWGGSCWIVAGAYCPTVLGVGCELLTGFGKGLALWLGPLWIGIAATRGVHPKGEGEQ